LHILIPASIPNSTLPKSRHNGILFFLTQRVHRPQCKLFGPNRGRGVLVALPRYGQNQALTRETLTWTYLISFCIFDIRIRWEYLHWTNVGLTKFMEVSVFNIYFTKNHFLQSSLFLSPLKTLKEHPNRSTNPGTLFFGPGNPISTGPHTVFFWAL